MDTEGRSRNAVLHTVPVNASRVNEFEQTFSGTVHGTVPCHLPCTCAACAGELLKKKKNLGKTSWALVSHSHSDILTGECKYLENV